MRNGLAFPGLHDPDMPHVNKDPGSLDQQSDSNGSLMSDDDHCDTMMPPDCQGNDTLTPSDNNVIAV